MKDDIWSREEIQSPCIKLCVIDPQSRLCMGCKRSIGEITDWSRLSPAARADVMAELPTREVPAPKRRGGRQGRLSS